MKRTDSVKVSFPFKFHFNYPDLALLFLAGCSGGLFIWSLTIDSRLFNSYLFFNTLPPEKRSALIAIMFSAGLVFVLTGLIAPPNHSSVKYLPFALLCGFIPLLAVRAIEIYHRWLTISLVLLFLTLLLFLSLRLARLRPGSPGAMSSPISKTAIPAVLLLCAAYALLFSIYTLKKHDTFHTYAFDLGWQNQVFYTLLETGNPRVTGFVPLYHMGNHFQPIYYLLSPLYALSRKPETLLVLQTLFLSAAAVPIYLMALKRTESRVAALILSSVYLLYPALQGINSYDFHGLSLLVPILSVLLYAMDSGRRGLFWTFFFLALITREDAAVNLCGVGLYLLLIERSSRKGALVIIIALGYFLISLKLMSLLGGFANLENYWKLTLPEDENFLGVIKTIASNPFYTLRHILFDEEKLFYLTQMLTPLLFLPVFSYGKALIALPALSIILLSGTSAQYSIGFQYSSHLIPYLFFLSACGLENLKKRRTEKEIRFIYAPLLAAGLLMNSQYGILFSKSFAGFPAAGEYERTARSFMEMIPGDASVATISRLYPHLSGRREISLLHRIRDNPLYILADLSSPPAALDSHEMRYSSHSLDRSAVKEIILEKLKSGSYGVEGFEMGYILLKHREKAPVDEEIITLLKNSPDRYDADDGLSEYYRDPQRDTVPAALSESEKMLNYLTMYRSCTVLLSVKGDGNKNLSYMLRKYLLYRGSMIHNLRDGGSYLAVIEGGKILYEEIGDGSVLEYDSEKTLQDHAFIPDRKIYMLSSAMAGLENSVIKIDGVNYSPGKNGFNAVALNRSGRIVDTSHFNTGGYPDE